MPPFPGLPWLSQLQELPELHLTEMGKIVSVLAFGLNIPLKEEETKKHGEY